MKRLTLALLIVYPFVMISCQKETSVNETVVTDTTVTNNPNVPGNINQTKVITGLVFNIFKIQQDDQYYSTYDTSFKKPMQRLQITAAQMANVDLLYVFPDGNLSEDCGFMDPNLAGQSVYEPVSSGYEKYFNFPSLSAAKRTIFYTTSLNEAQFNSAKNSPSAFKEMIKDTTLAQVNFVGWNGRLIGGKYGEKLTKGKVFAFKSTGSGKSGLLLISSDQREYWPMPITSFNTKVDIVVEK